VQAEDVRDNLCTQRARHGLYALVRIDVHS